MAPQGGYQRPRKPDAISGPGKKSRRTDGFPKGEGADLDRPDQSFGDRQMQEEGQKLVPLQASAQPAPSRSAGGSPSRGRLGGGQGLPAFLTQMESRRPGEPITAGAPFGPGAGPEGLPTYAPADETEDILLALLEISPGNPDIQRDLDKHRATRDAGLNERPPGLLQPPPGGGVREADAPGMGVPPEGPGLDDSEFDLDSGDDSPDDLVDSEDSGLDEEELDTELAPPGAVVAEAPADEAPAEEVGDEDDVA